MLTSLERFQRKTALAAVVLMVSACADAPTTPDLEVPGPLFAKPGGKGGGNKNAPPPITVTFLDRLGDNIRSDGRGSYVDGACGVTAFFSLEDARLTTGGNIRRKDATACGGTEPRAVMVSFTQRVLGSPPGPQNGNTVAANFFKVNEVELVTEGNGTVLRSAVVHGAGCAFGLRFNPNLDPNSDLVTVTKIADGTWTVATQDYPDNVAACLPDEDSPNPAPPSYYHLSFSITVVLK